MAKGAILGLLWANFAIVTCLAIVYCVVGWFTFANIKRVSYKGEQPFQTKISDSIRISLFISIMATILHVITAFTAHLRESLDSKEDFSYGYIGGSSFLTAVIVFIASTQQANADSYFFNLSQNQNWSNYFTRLNRSSYGVGYSIVAVLLANYLVILIAYAMGGFKSVGGSKTNKASVSADQA